MGLFDFFKRKTSQPPVKPLKTERPEVEENAKVKASSSGISWSVWPTDVDDFQAALAQEHAVARAMGLRVIVYSYEPWSPGSVAFKKFGTHPLAAETLRGIHIVEINMGVMDKMNAMGIRAVAVPQLWAFDTHGQFQGQSITGSAWGADTPENIAAAMRRWLEEIGRP